MFIKGYSEVSLSRTGILYGAYQGAHFKLNNDVSLLFPYINATLQDARFHDKPEHIQFVLDDIRCTLYPDELIAASFIDQDQAVKFVKRCIDFLNDLYARKDTITPNHKKIRKISVIDIYKLLPKTNCKECGFLTCLAFAAALSKAQTTPDRCPGFSSPISENAVYPVYDKHGNLASTVSIEIDAAKREHDFNKQEKSIEILKKKLTEQIQKNREPDNAEIRTDLTDREIQVLRLVAEGSTNTEISEILSISPHTVKSHVVHIFNKLGVNDRTQAAVWATRHKII